MGLSSITSRLLLQCTRLQRQLWSTLRQHKYSTGTNVLGASACSLCRTCCYRDRWLRFSPCRVLRLPMHLSWGTSRQYQQCTRHLHLSRSTSRCTSSVRYICTCGGVNAPASAHTLHLRLPWSTSRQHNQCLTPRQHGYCLLCASACILCYLLRLQ